MATQVVDHSALKVNQAGIVATVLVAFIGSAFFRPALVLIPLLAIVLLLGTFAPQLALFKQVYFKVLKPRGIVKPRPVQDRPEPHNFAQGMGGVGLAIASMSIPVAVLIAVYLVATLTAATVIGFAKFASLAISLLSRHWSSPASSNSRLIAGRSIGLPAMAACRATH